MKKVKLNYIVIGVVIFLLAIMFIASRRSVFTRQLQGPTEGSGGIVTINDRLCDISKNNHIFFWQWKDLSIWPVVTKPNARVITPVSEDKIIFAPSTEYNGLVLSNIKEQKQLASLDIPSGGKCEKIKSSDNGKYAAISISFEEGVQKNWFRLAVLDIDLKGINFVFQKDTTAENFVISDFDVNNDGTLLAGAGQKGKNKAWIFISDVNTQNILWEKTFEEYNQFTLARFSSDGKKLFVAEKARNILAFDSSSGQVINKYVMDEYQTVAHLKQNISCMAISPDVKILAANTEPVGKVWLWDIASGRKMGIISVGGGLIVSGVAFSPDSKYLATACMTSPEIKIWKVPQTENSSK